MTYKDHIHNGNVVFDESVQLDDGTPVSVEVMPAYRKDPEANVGTGESDELTEQQVKEWYELYRPIIGIVEDKPADWALNCEEYLRASLER